MKKRLPKKKKSTVKAAAPPAEASAIEVSLSPDGDPVKGKWVSCDKCGVMWTGEHRHVCDPLDVAAYGKNVCIDCRLNSDMTIEELTGIPKGGYCKHLTPEWWESQGWQRKWGDAAVMAWPELEILRRDDGDSFRYLILNGKLRRPVEIYAAKDGSGSWGSY